MPNMTMVYVGNNQVPFESAVNLMDNEIREEVAREANYEPETQEQDFVNAYCKAHKAKHGEDFVVN